MNSKKAQSEIITTVLIILLVLAAIIIVWQVVQSTIGNTKKNIDYNKLCLGSQLSIIKATAGNGTCTYADLNAVMICPPADKTVTRLLNGAACPVSPNAKCIIVAGTLPTPDATKPGKVIVTREASSGNEDNVTVRVYVDNVQNPAISGPLAVYGRAEIPVVGLNVSQEVKVASVLSTDNYLCSAAQTAKVTAP